MPDINDSNLGPFEESLASFYDYCQMPHGGQKNAEQAQAETAKIFALATTLHEDPAALSSLLEVWRDEMTFWLKFIKKALEDRTRQPTTLKEYSSTLEFYLNFLITREPPSRKYSLGVEETCQFNFLAKIQPKWRTALAKPAREQRQGQLQKDRENLLLVTEMRTVTQSKVFLDCQDELLSGSAITPLESGRPSSPGTASSWGTSSASNWLCATPGVLAWSPMWWWRSFTDAFSTPALISTRSVFSATRHSKLGHRRSSWVSRMIGWWRPTSAAFDQLWHWPLPLQRICSSPKRDRESRAITFQRFSTRF